MSNTPDPRMLQAVTSINQALMNQFPNSMFLLLVQDEYGNAYTHTNADLMEAAELLMTVAEAEHAKDMTSVN